jgi:hypothetical protein
MARRKARRSKKMEPVPLTLTFDLGATDVAPAGPGVVATQKTYFIDLSQCTSLAARKFMRQGLFWNVQGMKLNSVNVTTGTESPVSNAPEGSVLISKLPNTWTMSNAWHKGFAAWQRMQNEALEEAESVKAKFTDFKIFADADHHDAGVASNLLPVVGTPFNWVQATPAFWDMSTYRIPVGVAAPGDTTDREVIAVGPNYPGNSAASGKNAVSLIEGYASSRALPDITDPNTPADADDATGTIPENWISATFSDGTEQDSAVLTDLTADNDQAPYPFENADNPAGGTFSDTFYPGGANQLSGLEVVTLENITGTTVGGVSYLSGDNFPCGLIRIDIFNNDQTFDMYNVLQVQLAPGPTRGYLALPMQEM